MLTSSVLQILDRRRVQEELYPRKYRSMSDAASRTETADRPDTSIRTQDREEGSAAVGSSQPSQANHGNSETRASLQVFGDFLRAVEKVTKHPPSPALDFFQ